MSIDARIEAVTVVSPEHCETCGDTGKDAADNWDDCPSCHGATKDNPQVRLKLVARDKRRQYPPERETDEIRACDLDPNRKSISYAVVKIQDFATFRMSTKRRGVNVVLYADSNAGSWFTSRRP